MIKVLFICHGNICRSPMAKFIFLDLINKENLHEHIYVDSCAVSYEEIGNDIYPPAKKILEKHNISYSNHQAKILNKSDYDNYDYLVVMDKSNIIRTISIVGNDKENKITLLLSYLGLDRNVADPWYSNDFETAYNDIYNGCVSLLKHIKENNLK